MSSHDLTKRNDTSSQPHAIETTVNRTRELLNLNEILSERAALYEQLCGPAITVTTRLASDLDPVLSRPMDVERLLLNLIMTARSNMPFGGRLDLATSNVSSKDSLQKHSVRLQVEMMRNSPEDEQAADQRSYWDQKVARSLMQSVVAANGGLLTACQQSELVATTEILLPSSRKHE